MIKFNFFNILERPFKKQTNSCGSTQNLLALFWKILISSVKQKNFQNIKSDKQNCSTDDQIIW